jgi:hypothetical protein
VTPCLAEYFGRFGVQLSDVAVPGLKVKKMRAARLKELEEMEEMAAELLATARKLPTSQERREIFQEIRNIRARIDGLKAKGK